MGHEIKHKAPKVAALAVTLSEDQVLLVRRKNEPDAGLWGFPGGHVDLGETALFAAARELREETSVIGRPLQYLTNLDVIVRDEYGSIRFHFLLAVVLCEYISGVPKAADDVSKATWVAVDDVLLGKLRCSEHVDDVIRLATGCQL
ncbi:NUDIX hydrolase [Amylibacter sp.]|jgi:ADP-ribose pyrophosphatase YjhB (NUDIX family)|nr:NUDIX hydrolase [Amylibacter sp.]MDB9992334.1 NUDIX hydrolase [Amylibacter sp.]|tara:strand:- start:101 stop:538 length:438 start_codon:yes stop_codon:yes gene_type:complete